MIFHGEKAIDVARGVDPWFSQVNIVGRNPDIGIGTEDVWDGGGEYTQFPAAALLFASSTRRSEE